VRRPRTGLAAAVLAAAFAAAAAGANASGGGWEKLKSLAGSWKGTAEGKPVAVTYTLVSNGTALMESLEGDHALNMITMYAPDGATLLATHYCAAGNQPRMRAEASPDGGSLAFDFVDVSNGKGAEGEIMRKLVVTFVDTDHFNQQWTSRGKDGKDRTSLFQYTRVK